MATKKQKRAAAEAKRARMMEEYRRSGLEAQRIDRERRARKSLEIEKQRDEKREKTRQNSLRALNEMRREEVEDSASLEMECI